ncbi:MAG: glutamine synthetase III [Oscillospiraceae bacterium]|nr:glutamine synthetase III [Oscillospiraceae bacterium]
MKNVPSLFGSAVFHDAVMRERLPRDTYRALKKTMSQGTPLELDVANVVATAMKDWAIEKGVTHYTHWFQPMTGVTAEKHDSFISPAGDGKIIMEFSGKELVQGEPDASSFPSGGLRASFEARGYTIWDTTSYAFIKDDSLYIPTAFCSYSGEVLDKKTPLLRSMETLNKEAMRILKLFGNTAATRVISYAGPEQEYFLVDKEMYLQRPDLVHTGRTLFGARPPKGQELEDHYFGSLKPRISAFMKELEEELWKLGVYAKTKHNEAAPGQFELAPIYTTTNVATDHNQITMELLKNVADRHGLACLLHEKPFAGISGSGKHNNWSIATDTGSNLLEPGETPYENAQFLLFLVAVIQAVDKYQDLLRLTAASAGNDHRLGAAEAPPAIISIFLGDELTEILEAIDAGTDYENREKIQMEIGVSVLPHFPKDVTDRNRTSPFAFTGNKFEFRMPGSAFSIAGPNIILNTVVAESLRRFADRLEGSEDFKADLATLIKDTFRIHRRVVFNGDNYSNEWTEEAARRELSNLKTTPEALPAFIGAESVALFESHHVLSKTELNSRYEILMAGYSKASQIEGYTMVDMVRRQIIPAVIAYQNDLATLFARKMEVGRGYDQTLEDYLLSNISALSGNLLKALGRLEEALAEAKTKEGVLLHAMFCRDHICSAMGELRTIVDELETLVAKQHWPVPCYAALLNSIV